MITFTETKPEDISKIKRQAEQTIGHGLERAVQLGVAETMWVGDEPIAAYGIVNMWDGVAHIWALLSDEATDSYPVALTRRVKQMLEEMIDVGRPRSMALATGSRMWMPMSPMVPQPKSTHRRQSAGWYLPLE